MIFSQFEFHMNFFRQPVKVIGSLNTCYQVLGNTPKVTKEVLLFKCISRWYLPRYVKIFFTIYSEKSKKIRNEGKTSIAVTEYKICTAVSVIIRFNVCHSLYIFSASKNRKNILSGWRKRMMKEQQLATCMYEVGSKFRIGFLNFFFFFYSNNEKMKKRQHIFSIVFSSK